MDSLESLDFSSFIIFSDDPWSLLVSFRQLFRLPLVVQCCNVICEWPLTASLRKSIDVKIMELWWRDVRGGNVSDFLSPCLTPSPTSSSRPPAGPGSWGVWCEAGGGGGNGFI